MVTFEVDQPPPIPPRRSHPISLGLRLRRERNLWISRVQNFWESRVQNIHLEFTTSLKLFAFIALFIDLFVTSLGVNVIQQLHLTKEALSNEWQHVVPTIVLIILYLMPVIGVYKKSHLLLLVYVSITLFYLLLAFLLEARAAYKSHYAHYYYRVHYCPTRFVANDSVLCILALLKTMLLWPVFRCYMHTRDCLEFNFYMRRENRNTYGLVEFDEVAKVQQQQPKPKQYTSQPNIYTPTPTAAVASPALEPSIMVIDSLVDPIYENAHIRSPHSSSLVSSEDIALDDEFQFAYLSHNNNDEEDYESSLEDIEEEEDEVLGDRITYDNRIDLEEDAMEFAPGPVSNPMFGI